LVNFAKHVVLADDDDLHQAIRFRSGTRQTAGSRR
jgi:hypothetical protein